jgi:effector-binding domain-containing protein
MLCPWSKLAWPALLVSLSLACQSSGPASSDRPGPQTAALEFAPDLPVARAPFDGLAANWKQRMPQPYAYREARGSYTQIGRLLESLHRDLLQIGWQPSGPPFALYYDDPAVTPVDELRMRACFPVDRIRATSEGLAVDELDSATVVYAFVAGPYPEVPRAYPKLFAYLDELGWVENGPVREVYLVNPADVQSWDELVTEVQIPAGARP